MLKNILMFIVYSVKITSIIFVIYGKKWYNGLSLWEIDGYYLRRCKYYDEATGKNTILPDKLCLYIFLCRFIILINLSISMLLLAITHVYINMEDLLYESKKYMNNLLCIDVIYTSITHILMYNIANDIYDNKKLDIRVGSMLYFIYWMSDILQFLV